MLFKYGNEVIVLTELLKRDQLRNNEQTETSLNYFPVGEFLYSLRASKGYGHYYSSRSVYGVIRFRRQ